MSKEDREKLETTLRSMSLQDLASALADPCEDCKIEHCPGKSGCGYYESEDGVILGPVQIRKELTRRQSLINSILKGR